MKLAVGLVSGVERCVTEEEAGSWREANQVVGRERGDYDVLQRWKL